MKFDKNPRHQNDRIDKRKQDRIRTVTKLPDQPGEGDAVVLACQDGSRCLAIFSEGTWRYAAVSATRE